MMDPWTPNKGGTMFGEGSELVQFRKQCNTNPSKQEQRPRLVLLAWFFTTYQVELDLSKCLVARWTFSYLVSGGSHFALTLSQFARTNSLPRIHRRTQQRQHDLG